jgi:hypothetical protein
MGTGPNTRQVLTERTQPQIASSTAGIAFLGTPFHGTDDRFHRELPRMAEANMQNVDDRILHYLRRNDPTLEDLVQEFLRLRNERRPGMPRMACFYECRGSQVNRIIPDPNPLEASIHAVPLNISFRLRIIVHCC